MMYIKTWGTRQFCAPVFHFMRLFSAWTGIISAASFYKKERYAEKTGYCNFCWYPPVFFVVI